MDGGMIERGGVQFIYVGAFTESETQSLNPQKSTAAKQNSLLTGKNLEQNRASKAQQRGPIAA